MGIFSKIREFLRGVKIRFKLPPKLGGRDVEIELDQKTGMGSGIPSNIGGPHRIGG